MEQGVVRGVEHGELASFEPSASQAHPNVKPSTHLLLPLLLLPVCDLAVAVRTGKGQPSRHATDTHRRGGRHGSGGAGGVGATSRDAEDRSDGVAEVGGERGGG